MPLDAHARRLLDMLGAAAQSERSADPLKERRQSFAALMRMSAAAPAGVEVSETSCPGPGGPVALRLYAPAGAGEEPLPALVYFHGGGMVAGSLDTHDRLCRTLAASIGCRIVAVDYRLAPEHPFPAAIEDGVAAMAWVADHAAELGIAADRLGIAGDSAGAGLAVAVCQRIRDDGAPPLALQLLLCPFVDFAAESASRRALAHGYLLDRDMVAGDLADYCAGEDPANPLISPLRASRFDALPPTHIHTAEFDPLRDEGKAYADALAAAGVGVHHRCHAGLIHLFYGLTAVIPAARNALLDICAEARASLFGPHRSTD